MKKIMFAALVVMAACFAQANTVKWGIQSTSAPLGITSGTIYLVNGTLPSTDWDSKTKFADSDITGNIITSAKLVGGMYTDSTGFYVDSLTGKQFFYEVVIADDGLSMAITTGTKSAASMTTAVTSSTLQWSSSAFAIHTASTGAPEPTSGLLLLVGGAMLALRRKQK